MPARHGIEVTPMSLEQLMFIGGMDDDRAVPRGGVVTRDAQTFDQADVEFTTRRELIINALADKAQQLVRRLMARDTEENKLLILNEFDLHILAIAEQLGKTPLRGGEWQHQLFAVLQRILPSGLDLEDMLNQYFAKHKEGQLGTLLITDLLAVSILRAMAQFGMWKSVQLSVYAHNAVAEGAGRQIKTPVAAVAIGYDGMVIAVAHKAMGQTGDHAEEILLRDLRDTGRTQEVAMVVTNLEPCDCRSEKHRAAGHADGCSRHLVNANIPCVAYVLEDDNIEGRGRGSDYLREKGTVVLRSADIDMIKEAAALNVFKPFKIATFLSLPQALISEN